MEEKTIQEAMWPTRVAFKYGDIRGESPQKTSPFGDLAFLKEAIKDVTSDMMQEARLAASLHFGSEVDDQIGWVMRAVRAIECGHRRVLLRCIRVCPEIGRLVNPYDQDIRAKLGLRKLRHWAVQLHREILLEEMRDLQRESETSDEEQLRPRKNRIQVSLNRLKPGRCESIAAIQNRAGVVISDSAEIDHQRAEALLGGYLCL